MEVNGGILVVREIDLEFSGHGFLLPKTHDGMSRSVEVVSVGDGSLYDVGDVLLHEKDVMFIDAFEEFGLGCNYIGEKDIFAKVVDGMVVAVNEVVYLEFDGAARLNISGIVLDNSFNQFRDDLVVQSGIVVSIPKFATSSYIDGDNGLDIDIEVGDLVYGHHFMGHEDNIRVVGDRKFSEIRYEELYARVRDGGMSMLGGWNFLEVGVVFEEKVGKFVVKESGFDVVGGIVRFRNSGLGVDVGSRVLFKKNRDYRVFVDGIYYYRVHNRDIICGVKD